MKRNSTNNLCSLLPTALCLLGVFASTGAVAGGYIGLDGSSVTVDRNQNDEISPVGGRFRLGTKLAPMIDVELHVGGANESETDSEGRFATRYFGGFLKGYIPFGSHSAFYGLAGVTSVSVDQTIGNIDLSDELSGFSYGFGMETEISERVDLSGDFMRYGKSDGQYPEITAISLGIKLYF